MKSAIIIWQCCKSNFLLKILNLIYKGKKFTPFTALTKLQILYGNVSEAFSGWIRCPELVSVFMQLINTLGHVSELMLCGVLCMTCLC